MRAWVIRDREDDGKPRMVLDEVPVPEPGPGEVRIRVSAVGVNRADLLQVKGLYPPPAGFDPQFMGQAQDGLLTAEGLAEALWERLIRPLL